MSFPYKKILVLGATSGIGLAFSEQFIQHDLFVIAVGRRQENLDAFVQKHGSKKVAAMNFDITKHDKIPGFVAEVTKAHPDLDCVFVNSGIQRRSVFSEPETIDMSVIQEEVTVNYLSPLALTKEFVPFFYSKKDSPTSLMFTTSGLALVPMPRASNYSASKAALHHWLMCLREQLSESNIKVLEILPPAVQTELHDAKHQPDVVNGHLIGMPLKQYTDETIEELFQGKDQIANGPFKNAFDSWEQQRQAEFKRLVEQQKSRGGPPKGS